MKRLLFVPLLALSVVGCQDLVEPNPDTLVDSADDHRRRGSRAHRVVKELRHIVGGTYRDRDLGVIGTAFLYDPRAFGGSTDYYDVTGPAGWNGDQVFRCFRYRPAGTAASRALCWNFIPPLSGRFGATASDQSGRSAMFKINASNTLVPPTITSVSEESGNVTISWHARHAKSFLVRVNPLPFDGSISGEMVVTGSARSATLSGLTLAPGAPHQVVVFGFNYDLTHVNPPPPRQFNIGAQGALFTPS